VPEDPRPPVAVRIARPQASEDDLLEQELDTITRTGVTLLGAQPRPQGVVLRFEIALSNGTIVLRGEGRVTGFKPNAHEGLGGLTLRFTRLDSKSKALVDKAQALRERRRPSGRPSMPPPLPVDVSPGPPSVAETSPALPPVEPSAPELVADSDPLPAVLKPSTPPPPLPPRSRAPAPSVKPPPALANGHAKAVTAPASRDALLERLRSRAKGLAAPVVKSILEQKRRG
jgi:hypothetical protein